MRGEDNKKKGGIEELLGGLPRVEAPGDFDFRLKARLAGGKAVPHAYFPRLQFLKISIPAALLVAMGMFIFVSGPGDVGSVVVTDVPSPIPSETERAVIPPRDVRPEPAVVPIQTPNGTPTPEHLVERAVTITDPQVEKPELRRNEVPQRGSEDHALSPSQRRLAPRGIDPNSVEVKVPEGLGSGVEVSVNDILEMLGASGTYEQGGWRVRAVMADGPAARSGLRHGDLVELVNGKPVLRSSTIPQGTVITTMGIRRDGRHVQLIIGR
jgi:hypothetical protein